MAELPSTFWSGWVAVITVASLIGVFWLIYSVYFTTGSKDDRGAQPSLGRQSCRKASTRPRCGGFG